jgi:hypothetical protein
MFMDQYSAIYWPRTRQKLKTCATCGRQFTIMINRRRYGRDRGQHQRKYCSEECRKAARRSKQGQ